VNLLDLFTIAAARAPDKAALRPEASPPLTYGALHAAVEEAARGLAAQGLRPGDRVAFFLGNRPELVVAHLAVLRLGAVAVPINLAYRRREIAHILGDAEPRLLVTEAAERERLAELAPAERASVEEVLVVEELPRSKGDGAAAGPAADFAPPQVGGDDLALLLYTSGTTGRSKGAMLTHNNLLATVTGLLAAWAWRPDDALLLTLPLFHTHGLVVGLHCALAAGATVLLRRRFDAAAVAAELLGGAPTVFFGVPTMYVRLVEELRRLGAHPHQSPPRKLSRRAEPGKDARARLAGMRLFCSGSAPLAAETFADFAALTGHAILERYGMTETGMNLSNPYAGPRRPGTVGTPLPGVSIQIVDGEGKEVPPGGEGELLVRGGNVFAGYWRDPEKTAASFRAGAGGRRWFATGDLARRDLENGYVTLLGRRHELILCGGYNVYPREVEEVLAAFPGVREAAVVGRPDADRGEVPVAFVVAADGLEEAALLAHCKRELAPFKVPRAVHRLDALPRNALGKVQKHLLGSDLAGAQEAKSR
jgi:malonyl-CoA/methylmalonyl-CoA synthetase